MAYIDRHRSTRVEGVRGAGGMADCASGGVTMTDPAAWDGEGPDPTGGEHVDYLDESDRGTVGPERRSIEVKAGNLDAQVHGLIGALGESDRNIYQRNGFLVSIAREPERREIYERDMRVGNDIVMRPGTPRIRPLNPASLMLRSARAADWRRWSEKNGKGKPGERGSWVTSDPCSKTVGIVSTLGDWPGIAPLRGILETPALRPDGTVIEAPGYDEATGYVLLPSCVFRAIKARPTQEHARAALRFLWIETACDFPFRGMSEANNATDPDRVLQFSKAIGDPENPAEGMPDAFVAIAMLLTIFARPAILGAVPGGLFEAPGQGSGKSLQMHTVSLVATSRAAGVATFPMHQGRPDEQELEKILSGYALNGARIITFDNIRGLLSGAGLEKVLSAVDSIDLRVLGANDQRTIPWSAVAMFSGNNMVMSDDTAQRMLLSRIESPREDPRSRPRDSFRRADLLDSIRKVRPNLVRAVLTILRAFICAREDGAAIYDTGTLGSFEAWSQIVPPALAWAGGPNVLRARPEMGRGGDEEGEAHLMLMRAWPDAWQRQRGSYIIAEAFRSEKDIRKGEAPEDGLTDVRAAIRALTHAPEHALPSAHAFGIKLGQMREKIRDGRRIVRELDSGGVSLWTVRRAT